MYRVQKYCMRTVLCACHVSVHCTIYVVMYLYTCLHNVYTSIVPYVCMCVNQCNSCVHHWCTCTVLHIVSVVLWLMWVYKWVCTCVLLSYVVCDVDCCSCSVCLSTCAYATRHTPNHTHYLSISIVSCLAPPFICHLLSHLCLCFCVLLYTYFVTPSPGVCFYLFFFALLVISTHTPPPPPMFKKFLPYPLPFSQPSSFSVSISLQPIPPLRP